MKRKRGKGPAQQDGADGKKNGLGLSGLLPGIWNCMQKMHFYCMVALIRCLFGRDAVPSEDSLTFETVTSESTVPPLSRSYGLAADGDGNCWLLCFDLELGETVLSSIRADVSVLTAGGILHDPGVALIILRDSASPAKPEESPGDGELQIQIFRYAKLKEDCSGEEVLLLAMLDLLTVDEILACHHTQEDLRKAADAAGQTASWIEEVEPENGYPPGSLRVLQEEIGEALLKICGCCGDPDFGNEALDRLDRALTARIRHLRMPEAGPVSAAAPDAIAPQHIFDRSLKRIVILSNRVAVLVINGLFGTRFEPDSDVIHRATESVSIAGKVTFADAIIEIRDNEQEMRGVFLIEFMSKFVIEKIQTVVDYVNQATHKTVRKEKKLLQMKRPVPCVLYLFKEESAGDATEVESSPDFEMKGSTEILDSTYYGKIPNVQFLARSFEDNVRDLLPLLPFEILRYRDEVDRTPSDQLLVKVRSHAERIRDALVNAGGSGGKLDDYEVSSLLDITQNLYLYAYGKLEDQTGEEVTVMQNALIDLSPSGELYRMHQQIDRERKARKAAEDAQEAAETRIRQMEAFIRENGLTPPPPGNSQTRSSASAV